MSVAVQERVEVSGGDSTVAKLPPDSVPRRLVPWSDLGVSARLRVLRNARHLLAANASALADAIPAFLPRARADSLVAEVLPLLAAIKFLERDAAIILAPRRLGRRGLPYWLAGLKTTVERVPLGEILILAPFNYPLLLAGVQTMQALAAGNSVVWKPGRGGRPVAQLFAELVVRAGLPLGLLRVAGETVDDAEAEMARRPAKILFTGGAHAGRAVLHAAAETLTPVTAELSGCDAVLVLPTADPQVVADAMLFGLRLNGSQTCMAPRRLIFVETQASPRAGILPGAETLAIELHPTFAAVIKLLRAGMTALPMTPHSASLATLIAEAEAEGATHLGERDRGPALLLNARPGMRITHSDVFAPVLSVLRAASPEQAVEMHNASRLSLTAAIFGASVQAGWIARELTTGTVVINDLIAPTADPRIPFGGRGDSGFGVTRGREGLLELTAAKTITVRRNRNYRHLQPTTAAHESLFTGLIEFTHAGPWTARWAGFRKLLNAARKLPR